MNRSLPFKKSTLFTIIFLLIVACSKDKKEASSASAQESENVSNDSGANGDRITTGAGVPDVRRGINTQQAFALEQSYIDTKNIKHSECLSSIADSEGNHLCGGYVETSSKDILIIKTDSNGKPLWSFSINEMYSKIFKSDATLQLVSGNNQIKISDLDTNGDEQCIKIKVDSENNIYCLAKIEGKSSIAAKYVERENEDGTKTPLISFMLIRLTSDGKLYYARQVGQNYHNKSIKSDFGLEYSSPLFEEHDLESPMNFSDDLTPTDFAISEDEIVITAQTRADFVYDETMALENTKTLLEKATDFMPSDMELEYPIFFVFDFLGNLKKLYQIPHEESSINEEKFELKLGYIKNNLTQIVYDPWTRNFSFTGYRSLDYTDLAKYVSYENIFGNSEEEPDPTADISITQPFIASLSNSFDSIKTTSSVDPKPYFSNFFFEFMDEIDSQKKIIIQSQCIKFILDEERNFYCAGVSTFPYGKYSTREINEYGFPINDKNIQLLKYNYHGYLEWVRQIDDGYVSKNEKYGDTTKDETVIDMKYHKGEIYLLAQTKGSIEDSYGSDGMDNNGDTFIVKYSRDGDVLWSQQWGKNYFEKEITIHPKSLHLSEDKIFMSGSISGENEFSCYYSPKESNKKKAGFIIDLSYHMQNKSTLSEIKCP